MAQVQEGARNLNAQEIRALAEKLQTMMNGLNGLSMFKVVGSSGVMRVFEERGFLRGFAEKQQREDEESGRTEEDVMLDALKNRGMSGDAQAAKLWLEEMKERRATASFGDVQIIITPFDVPDKVRVLLENKGAKDAGDIRARLVAD